MSVLGSPTSGILERMAAFAERRHAVLATNVARIDVPGYERHDLDVEGFQQALNRAVAKNRASRSEGSVPDPQWAEDPFPTELFQAKPDAERNIRFHDSAVRSVEAEMTELITNSMKHAFATELLKSQHDTLHAIISERP